MTNRHQMMVSTIRIWESNRLTALKTLSMRIRGYDEETEQYIGGVEQLSGDIADLTKTADHPEGISLFTDKNKTEYKSTVDLLRDISKIYDDLTDKQQARLLEKLAGKRQGQIVSAILDNFDAVESSLKSMSESAGSAMAEMETVSESLTFKLNALRETGVGIAQNLFTREDMGVVVDGLTQILGIIDSITGEIGLFGTVGTGAGIAGILKIAKLGGVEKSFASLAKYLGLSTTALGSFIGVSAGIAGTIALIDLCTTSFGEMQKKAEDSRKSYNETQSSLESLNKELSENNIRRKELQNKDKLSINEQQELNNLERQNRLLENQIKLQERLAEIQGRSAATAANEVLSKPDSFGSLSLIDRYSARQNQLNSLNRQEEALSTKMQRYTPEDMADVSPFARNARQQAYQDDKAELERIQQESQELTQKMSEDAATMQENYASLFDANGNVYEGCVDTVRKYNEAVLYSGTATEVAAQKQQALSDIISEYVPKADQASFSMEKFTESIGEEKLSDLQTQLAEAGLSLSDFEYSLSDVGDTIAHGDLKDGAEDAVKSLEKLSKFKDEVGIGSALTITAEGDDYRKVLERNINQMNDLKLRPDVDTSDIENANKIIAYCESELQELDKPAILKVDTKGLSKGQKELVSLLNEFNQVSNQRDIEVSVGADTSESDAKLAELQGKIQDQSAELEIDAEVDTSSVDSIKSALQNNDFAVALDMNVDPLPDQNANGTVNWKDNYDKMPDQTANGIVNWKDNYTNTLSVSNQYRYIYWTNVSTNSPPSGGGNRANGSAHAYGTSYAGGYWGVGAGGRTLVGELGISYAPLYSNV